MQSAHDRLESNPRHHDAVEKHSPVSVGPSSEPTADEIGPVERWVMRGSGIVLVVLCAFDQELNLCGLLLGAGLLAASFLD